MSKNALVESTGSNLTLITRQDVEALQEQRKLLKEFVFSQLKEAQFKDEYADDYGDGDYGVIRGTKKNTLLKPGAEKILQLFNLGNRVKQLDKTIDKDANFAMYEYECEIFSKKTGQVVATCIGTANSQEIKYKERTVWFKEMVGKKEVKKSRKEKTPIFDVLNTLSKMAQKRALVGATILATAASDFFTQDMEPDEVPPESKAKDVTPGAQAEASPPAQEEKPICCEKPMMISKYPDNETGEHPWYCTKCKSKKPSGVFD